MDKKRILLTLCEEIYDAVYYLFSEDSDMSMARTGESLMQFGGVLSKIGWILTWGEEQEIEKMFNVIEDAFTKGHWLKCRIEEWLNWKLQEIENEMNQRIQPAEKEESELKLNPEPKEDEKVSKEPC